MDTNLLAPDIQPKRYRPSALWRRVTDSHPEPQYAVSSYSSYCKDVGVLGNVGDEKAASNEPRISPRSTTKLQFQWTPESPNPPSERPYPRRFHLAPTAPSFPPTHSRGTNGVQKSSKRRGQRLAVFVERTRNGQVASKNMKLRETLQRHSQLEVEASDKRIESTRKVSPFRSGFSFPGRFPYAAKIFSIGSITSSRISITAVGKKIPETIHERHS